MKIHISCESTFHFRELVLSNNCGCARLRFSWPEVYYGTDCIEKNRKQPHLVKRGFIKYF